MRPHLADLRQQGRERSLEELPARLSRLFNPLELGFDVPSQAGGDYLRTVLAKGLDERESKLRRNEGLSSDIASGQERGDDVGPCGLRTDALPLHLLQKRRLVVPRRTRPEVLLDGDRLHVDVVALPEGLHDHRLSIGIPPSYGGL